MISGRSLGAGSPDAPRAVHFSAWRPRNPFPGCRWRGCTPLPPAAKGRQAGAMDGSPGTDCHPITRDERPAPSRHTGTAHRHSVDEVPIVPSRGARGGSGEYAPIGNGSATRRRHDAATPNPERFHRRPILQVLDGVDSRRARRCPALRRPEQASSTPRAALRRPAPPTIPSTPPSIACRRSARRTFHVVSRRWSPGPSSGAQLNMVRDSSRDSASVRRKAARRGRPCWRATSARVPRRYLLSSRSWRSTAATRWWRSRRAAHRSFRRQGGQRVPRRSRPRVVAKFVAGFGLWRCRR